MEFVEAMEENLPADPQHRRGADRRERAEQPGHEGNEPPPDRLPRARPALRHVKADIIHLHDQPDDTIDRNRDRDRHDRKRRATQPEMLVRSEEHTSELQSLMRIEYAVFCLTKKK